MRNNELITKKTGHCILLLHKYVQQAVRASASPKVWGNNVAAAGGEIASLLKNLHHVIKYCKTTKYLLVTLTEFREYTGFSFRSSVSDTFYGIMKTK